MTTSSIETLRAELERCSAAEVRLSSKAAEYRARLPELAGELAAALADGDDERAASLRSERQRIEAELRDVEPAQGVARNRTEAAERALARAQIDSLHAELAAHCLAFGTRLDELNKLASQIREKRREVTQCFSRAALDGGTEHPLHPNAAMRLGPVAAYVYGYLRDYENQALTVSA